MSRFYFNGPLKFVLKTYQFSYFIAWWLALRLAAFLSSLHTLAGVDLDIIGWDVSSCFVMTTPAGGFLQVLQECG
jgi:hypothetical protein